MMHHPVAMTNLTKPSKFRQAPRRIYWNLLTKQIKREGLINFAILPINSAAKKPFKSRQVTAACSSRSTMTIQSLKTEAAKIRRIQIGLNLIGNKPQGPLTGDGSLSIKQFSRS